MSGQGAPEAQPVDAAGLTLGIVGTTWHAEITGAQILVDLGVHTMRLLTNNPAKRAGLEGYGLRVPGRVPLPSTVTAENLAYLRTKRDRMGHLLDIIEPETEAGPADSAAVAPVDEQPT